jgi:hypothetical protein
VPEADWYLHHDETPTRELGVAAFLMTGTGATAVAGIAPYVVFEVGKGIFLRPALMVGESIAVVVSPSSDVRSTWTAGRLDACLRLPGLYTNRRGMQLDLCGGAEAGLSYFAAGSASVSAAPPNGVTMPYVNVGPSVDLRAEFGWNLSAALRGMTGYNIIQEGYEDGDHQWAPTPPFAGRIELAMSWRLR